MSEDAAKPAPVEVPCPACRALSPFEPSNRWRPFCSERCREMDLGAWASEGYRVAARAGDAGDGTDSGPD